LRTTLSIGIATGTIKGPDTASKFADTGLLVVSGAFQPQFDNVRNE